MTVKWLVLLVGTIRPHQALQLVQQRRLQSVLAVCRWVDVLKEANLVAHPLAEHIKVMAVLVPASITVPRKMAHVVFHQRVRVIRG